MYPYNDPYWTVRDQDYLCKMAGFGYPVSRIREPFRYIVENGKCATYKAEYQQYLDSLNQATVPEDTQPGTEEVTPDTTTTDATSPDPAAGGETTDPTQEPT